MGVVKPVGVIKAGSLVSLHKHNLQGVMRIYIIGVALATYKHTIAVRYWGHTQCLC